MDPRTYQKIKRAIDREAPNNVAVGRIVEEVEEGRFRVVMEGRRYAGTSVLVNRGNVSVFVGDLVNLLIPNGDINSAQIQDLSSKSTPITVTVQYGDGDYPAPEIEDSLIIIEPEAYQRGVEELKGGKIARDAIFTILFPPNGEDIIPGTVVRVTWPEIGLILKHLYIVSVDERGSNKGGVVLDIKGQYYEEWEATEWISI